MSHVDDGALHAYLDGELSPVERERLEAHLADCAPCRARLDEERGLVERASQLLGLASPPERAAPPPLHQLRQPRLMWRLRMPLAWAASVVLAVSLGYYVGGASLGRVAPSDSHDAMVGLTRTPPADSPALTPPAVAFSERSAATPPTGTPRHPPAPQPTPDAVVAREEHLVEQRAAEARPESAAAGQRLIELRGANALAGTPAEAGRAAARGELAASAWPTIERESARALLGADPVGVPGLPIREVRRSPAADGVVLVEQQVDSATVIQLFQRRVEAERQVAREAAPTAPAAKLQVRSYTAKERLARFVGSVRVEIAGPLPADSLSRLLERVKPIP